MAIPDLLERGGFGELDFLKMDIEGAENPYQDAVALYESLLENSDGEGRDQGQEEDVLDRPEALVQAPGQLPLGDPRELGQAIDQLLERPEGAEPAAIGAAVVFDTARYTRAGRDSLG